MGIKRVVNTSFWTDGKVIDMFSVEDKYFMLYLLTNPHTTQLGIYEFNIRQASFELGFSQDVVNVLLDRFENAYGIIRYSKQTKEIAIANYLRHSIIKGGKPVEDLLKKELKKVKDKSLIRFSFDRIEKYDDLNETVLKIIENEKSSLLNENDNENVNDNDNDESCTVRSTNRAPYAEIVDLYSKICISYPKCCKLSDARKRAISARLKKFSIDDFEKVFKNAEESDFLRGQNNRNWSATLDWMLKDANFIKILEGNYANKGGSNNGPSSDNKPISKSKNKFKNFEERDTDYDSLVAQYYGYGEENEKKSV